MEAAYDGVVTFMAQRDDAKEHGDQAGYDYWRGYIDAVCDRDGLDPVTCEAEYQRRQQFARHTLP